MEYSFGIPLNKKPLNAEETNDLMKRNVYELQQSLQSAYVRIKELREENDELKAKLNQLEN